MRYFYSESLNDNTKFVDLTDFDKKHLFKTLRADIGENIGLLNGKGIIATAKILEKNSFEIISLSKYSEPKTKIHLYLAMPKKQKIDTLLKQATEVGISTINPIITTNNAFKYIPKYLEKWQQSLIEGCKQSKNPYCPIINPPINFIDAINKVKNIPAFYGAVKESNQFNNDKLNADLAWFVGPEGGFTDEEEKTMELSNFIPFNISPHIMRIETAVIAGANLLRFLSTNR